MKHFLFSAIVLAGLFVLACQPAEEKASFVVVNGELANLESNSLLLLKETFGEIPPDTIRVSEKGTFTDTLALDAPAFFSFVPQRKRFPLYLEPGKTITISADAEDIAGTLSFSGSLKAHNVVVTQLNNWVQENSPNFRELYSQPVTEFVQQLQSLEEGHKGKLNELAEAHPQLEESFVQLMNAAVDYDMALLRMNYPSYYKYLTKEEAQLPSDFLAIHEQVDLNAHENLLIPEFQNLVRSYPGSMAEQNVPVNTPLWEKEHTQLKLAIELIEKRFTNAKVKEAVYYSYLDNFLKYNGVDGVGQYLDKFKEIAQNQELVKEIQEKYGKRAHLEKGSQAPDFSGVNLNGDTIHLSDLKGSLVYVDVWATWCGPCIREIPTLKTLEETYHNEDIHFVSISIDRDKPAWEKMVEERNLKGIQIYADGAWDSDVTNGYMIMGIPRFILINKDGTIFDANAPRPSGGVEEIFNHLLEM